MVFTCLQLKSLKTLWEKEKLLVTSNFSFFLSVFYSLGGLSGIFIKFKIVICKLFQFGRVLNLSFGKGLNDCFEPLNSIRIPYFIVACCCQWGMCLICSKILTLNFGVFLYPNKRSLGGILESQCSSVCPSITKSCPGHNFKSIKASNFVIIQV